MEELGQDEEGVALKVEGNSETTVAEELRDAAQTNVTRGKFAFFSVSLSRCYRPNCGN